MRATALKRGLWGVLATPFHGPLLEVDHDSLRRELDLYLGVPVDGLVVLGVFGEGAALDSSEQAAVVETVAAHAPGVPMVVGVSARTTAMAVEQARTAVTAAGVGPAGDLAGDLAGGRGGDLAGVMVQVNSPDPDVLSRHLQAVHNATGVGIVLQDYPEASGVRITSEDVLRVVDRCPFVVAVKSEAPPTSTAIGQAASATDVPVFGGLGGVGLLDELAAGAAGAMTGFSHPEGLRATLDAWAEGGFPDARAAFAPWLPLVNFEAQPGVGLALRKEILRRRGIFDDAAVRPPARSAPEMMLRLLPDHLNAVATTLGA